MLQDDSLRCSNCHAPLQTEREQQMEVCYECRRYGLLHGDFPHERSQRERSRTEGS